MVEGASADEKLVGLIGTGFCVGGLGAPACDVDCEELLTCVVNDRVNDREGISLDDDELDIL